MTYRFGKSVFLYPFGNVLAHHSRNHQGPAHTNRFRKRRTEGKCLEYSVFTGKSPCECQVRNSLTLVSQNLAEFVSHGVNVDTGHAPLFHHTPGRHARASGCPVNGKQVYFRLGSPFDGHGQFAQRISTGLEGNALEAKLSEAIDLGVEVSFVDESQSTMALEFLDGATGERFLLSRRRGVRSYNVATSLEFLRPFQTVNFNLAADAFGPLTPLELYVVQAVLVNDVLGHTEPGILNIHLHKHFAVTLMVATILLNTPVHIRRTGYLAVFVELQSRVDTTDVLAADEGDTANSRAHGKVLPVGAGYLC